MLTRLLLMGFLLGAPVSAPAQTITRADIERDYVVSQVIESGANQIDPFALVQAHRAFLGLSEDEQNALLRAFITVKIDEMEARLVELDSHRRRTETMRGDLESLRAQLR